jgi:MFS family permease
MFSRWAQTTFLALGNRNYRTLWLGTTVAFLAFMMSSIVQSIVAFDLTGKNGAVGFVALGMGVSTIVIAPFGGVIADRVSKRRLVLIGQSLIAVNFLTIGVLIVSDHITLAALVASTFVMGTVFSFIGPARQAWIGELVHGPELRNAIALQQVGMTATRVVGPFLAGGLVALSFVGTGGTYIFMGGLFAYVIFTLIQLPPTNARGGEGKSILGDFKLGWQHIRSRPRLALLVLSFMGVTMAGFSYQVVLPGYLKNQLDRDPNDIGLMFGVSAVSGLVVTLGIAGAANSRHAWRIMILGGVVLGGALMLTAVSATFPQALGAMLIAGAGSSAFQLLNNALVMEESDPAYYGRVMSLTMMAWGLNGIVGLPFGLFADAVGERETLFLMGGLVLAVAGATAFFHALLGRRPEPASIQVATVAGGE